MESCFAKLMVYLGNCENVPIPKMSLGSSMKTLDELGGIQPK